MPDYPDWQQIFRLVGSDITINVNIKASGVTLPISIDAVTADLEVTVTAVDATIDINFTDQSVAVFDAAKWFAHNADQIFVTSQDSINANSGKSIVTRTVPTGKTFFIAGFAWGSDGFAAITGTYGVLVLDGSPLVLTASLRGDAVIFDVPIRATTGQVIGVTVGNVSGSSAGYRASLWGWDEED
jgi:hypothetical protein